MNEAIAQHLDDNNIAVFNKTNATLNQIYLGQIDLANNTCIGIYNDLTVQEVSFIGGNEPYQEYGFSMLVHWSKSYNTAYEKAMDIYNLFKEGRFTSNNLTFWNTRCTSGKPIYVGVRNDVYEFVLNYFIKVDKEEVISA